MDRPELNELRELVESDSLDAVIVYDMDRLARMSVRQLIIEDEFRRASVMIEYVVGQYDDSDEGRMQKQIRAAIAEYERAKILERSRRGKRGKAKSGYVLVGARPPYGY
jgi:site-specific DNA recombinase